MTLLTPSPPQSGISPNPSHSLARLIKNRRPILEHSGHNYTPEYQDFSKLLHTRFVKRVWSFSESGIITLGDFGTGDFVDPWAGRILLVRASIHALTDGSVSNILCVRKRVGKGLHGLWGIWFLVVFFAISSQSSASFQSTLCVQFNPVLVLTLLISLFVSLCPRPVLCPFMFALGYCRN